MALSPAALNDMHTLHHLVNVVVHAVAGQECTPCAAAVAAGGREAAGLRLP